MIWKQIKTNITEKLIYKAKCSTWLRNIIQRCFLNHFWIEEECEDTKEVIRIRK